MNIQACAIDIFKDIPISDEEYQGFYEDLEELDVIISPDIYLEAQAYPKRTIRQSIRDAWDNAKTTTKAAAKVYGDVTDGGGTFLKSVANFVIKTAALIARIIKFILTLLAKIPDLIGDVIAKVTNLPENIRNKIRGNIKLNITVSDLQACEDIMAEFGTFAKIFEKIKPNDHWTRDRKIIPLIPFMKKIKGDMGWIKEAENSYNRLFKQVKFEPTTIEMKNQEVVDIYFSNNIKIHKFKGTSVDCTYYEALKDLLNRVQAQKPFIEEVHKLFGEKYELTDANGQLAEMKESERETIRECTLLFSKVISVIGNMVKYINQDMLTIRNTALKINKPVPNP
jgi:hypothetical protein